MKKVAIFIDAENIPSKFARDIFYRANRYGEIVIKRIYADWSNEKTKNWRKEVFEYGLKGSQQFSTQNGKNSSDLELCTEVMSLFYTKDIDTFVIVSSDRDFTPLVTFLREAEKEVVGIGLSNTQKFYKNSCSDFFILDNKKNIQCENNLCTNNEEKKQISNTQNPDELIAFLLDEKSPLDFATICQKLRDNNIDYKRMNFSKFRDFMTKFVEQNPQYTIEKGSDNATFYLKKGE